MGRNQLETADCSPACHLTSQTGRAEPREHCVGGFVLLLFIIFRAFYYYLLFPCPRLWQPAGAAAAVLPAGAEAGAWWDDITPSKAGAAPMRTPSQAGTPTRRLQNSTGSIRLSISVFFFPFIIVFPFLSFAVSGTWN